MIVVQKLENQKMKRTHSLTGDVLSVVVVLELLVFAGHLCDERVVVLWLLDAPHLGLPGLLHGCGDQ